MTTVVMAAQPRAPNHFGAPFLSFPSHRNWNQIPFFFFFFNQIVSVHLIPVRRVCRTPATIGCWVGGGCGCALQSLLQSCVVLRCSAAGRRRSIHMFECLAV